MEIGGWEDGYGCPRFRGEIRFEIDAERDTVTVVPRPRAP